MTDIEKLREEKNPTYKNVKRFVRYLINVKKLRPEEVYRQVSWEKEKVEKAIDEIAKENEKPLPKRYYVSLKEPLEDI